MTGLYFFGAAVAANGALAVVEPVETTRLAVAELVEVPARRRRVGISPKRFLVLATVLKTVENPVKTLFWSLHRTRDRRESH